MIKGNVWDSMQQPLADVSVQLLPDNKWYRTDKDGYFEFKSLYEGTYQITVQHVGFGSKNLSIPLERYDSTLCVVLTKENKTIEQVNVNRKVTEVDNLIQAENAAMPVHVITRREIELMGSRRLDEVMKEQTGVAIVNDISGGSRAVGVQIQGFSSNYVMVLIDGQPMLGRNNGNFDLSRISVTNIERIEIIKGASSCLYGSDALGGAINIITRQGVITPQVQASLLYGSLHVVDATIEGETPLANQRGSVVLSGNYYQTDGFNTDKQYLTSGSTTLAPYENISLQGRLRYKTSKNGTLGLTARYGGRNSTMINAWSNDLTLEDGQRDNDFNLGASYDHQLRPGLRTMSRYYYTRFQTTLQAQWLQQAALAGSEEFGQHIHRLEQQLLYTPLPSLKLTAGLGGSMEIMDNRDLGNTHSLNTAFVYAQTEWKTTDRILTMLGVRYDHTNTYNGRLSPSVGLTYQLGSNLLLKAGAGAGFKAPDYKMRYQIFFNPAANYLVVGNDRLQEVLETLDSQGELSYKNSYMVDRLANNLQAEKSWSNNLGITWNPEKKWQTQLSFFYHRIHNQINTESIGSGTSISQIYTYRNSPKVVNKGFEISADYHVQTNVELSIGYQYLIVKDLSVLDSIRSGRPPYDYYVNPTTGQYRKSKPSDYWGIQDRSKHMLNVKALYTYRPWQMNVNLRANIRGKYPVQETNMNQFIDDNDKFVPAHTLLNLTLEKTLMKNKLTLRVVADNLLNFTNRNMLGQPGRVILGGISYRWVKP
ncbi:TonB-dependent receptor [Sphingobacterium suaedae]|uniref:TonB-dependent receptor domain-containing protein n=1 Tax=Sphingobacterium suaedae TaxID=1686402 RepID=A0ABW5KCW4_9SPHI